MFYFLNFVNLSFGSLILIMHLFPSLSHSGLPNDILSAVDLFQSSLYHDYEASLSELARDLERAKSGRYYSP